MCLQCMDLQPNTEPACSAMCSSGRTVKVNSRRLVLNSIKISERATRPTSRKLQLTMVFLKHTS